MEGEIHRTNSDDFEEELKQSKTKHRRNKDENSRRRSCRRSRVVDTHYDLFLTQHHHDSTISALTMDDITTFQDMYDKCREIESSNDMRSTSPSRRHCVPPSPSTIPTATATATATTTTTLGDSGNERLNTRKSFYDLFLSRERESTISEITLEDWKSLNELYKSMNFSNFNDRSTDTIDYFQRG